VVALFNDVQRDLAGDRFQCQAKFIRRSERIAFALDEQHRNADTREMRRSQLIRLAGRMQRIPEQDDPCDS
jgi:hypothetical protein